MIGQRWVPRHGRVVVALLGAALAGAACGGGASSGGGSGAEQVVKVGLVVPLSGNGSANADPVIQGANLALDQINSKHLAGNLKLQFVQVDDATDPKTAQQVCTQLVSQDQVAAIVGSENTPSRAACEAAVQSQNLPYFAGNGTGGNVCYSNMFFFGIAPNQQVSPLVDYLTKKEGLKKYYILASDYAPPKGSVAVAAKQVPADGGTILDTTYEPLNTTQFSSDVAKIAAAQPDVVLDGLVGNDQIPFHKQLGDDPRTKGLKTASFQMNEAIAQAVGPESVGVTVADDYITGDPSAANKDWVAALKKKYGNKAQPSFFAAETYDATMMMAAAMKKAGGTDAAKVISAVTKVAINTERGHIVVKPGSHGYATLAAHIGQVNKDYGINQVAVTAPVDPQVTCPAS
ncbi:MAG: ABC transporter substrate-binding protein [Candidatus Dormibacteraeota bacterium]|nr:ABC transporter substrate-binding protein [Candidatus Dormibacteraeota bacterium]